ncbi:MAG: alpha/beta hydrolase [Desulfobacteraceae bacterium]|nr:alpha/beta hydrolase [Desulfobacteraceae bacterium]
MRDCFDYFYTHDRLSIRYGKWSSQKRTPAGSIVYLLGRAEFMEKNLDVIDRLCSRGFDVYAFEWRGQGLSDRMLANRHKGYVRDYADHLSDLHLFVQNLYLPAAALPKILIGHSMGGHIALHYLHDHPGIMDRAVLVSPMFDINTAPLPLWLVRRLTRLAVSAGRGDRYIVGAGDYSNAEKHFDLNPMTGDKERFMHEIREIGKNPDLALGGVTYQWLSASFASIDVINSPGYAEAVSTPVLMASGTSERVVSKNAHKMICSRLPDCRLLEIPMARHEILKETDEIQQAFWQAFDSFVAK